MKTFFSKRTRTIGIAVLVITILTSTAAFASTGSKTLEALYSNIKIYVNGAVIMPTDGNGKSTEPFIVDGTTYLPLRAVSEALGENVEWDGTTNSVYVGVNPSSTIELYAAAVKDAMTIEDDEILPLVEISENSDLCSWDDNGRVLMLTYHAYPDSYVAGEEYTLKYGAVWTFTDKEIAKWYKENKDGITDWALRFKQLIGLPEGRTYTHFSAMWVNPDDITRPGYAWELSSTIGAPAFAEEPDEEYKAWFDSNIVWSYFDSAYPWTRLGYTYDWAAGGSDYGLSEFLVKKDAVTQVEFTMTTEEFVTWLDAQ